MNYNYPQVAAAVYQACTTYDQYLPALSADVAKAWAKTFAVYALSPEDLISGVDAVYAERGLGYRPLPADIAQAARALRRERAEREDRAASAARQEALSAKAAEDAEALAERKGLPGPVKFKRRPRAAALNYPCPWCKAAVGSKCVVPMTNEHPAGGIHPMRIELATEMAGA